MVSNDDRSKRCEQLITAITEKEHNTTTQQENFMKIAGAAKKVIEDALHAKGLKSIDDLVAQVKSQLTPEHAKAFQDLIQSNKPPEGIMAFLPHDASSTITFIADFIGCTVASSGAAKILAGSTFDSRVGFSYVSATAKANQSLAVEVQAAAKWTELTGMRPPLQPADFRARLKTLHGQVERANSEVMKTYVGAKNEFVAAQQAAKSAQAAEKAAAERLLKARGTARRTIRRGLWGLVASLVIIGGTALYSHLHEKGEEEKLANQLWEAIADLATGRLYASQGADGAQSFATMAVNIFEIAKDFKEGKTVEMNAKLDTLTTLMGVIQPKDLKDEYNTLYAEDAKLGRMTSEDPKLEQMIERHKKAVASAGKDLES
ncbi:MAG: hypothetical protein M1833_006234 [Piccolia ochrophora]|nr:MAG: hypothetical protein M1833_006234 [Piccolia ochrophora]